MVQSGLEKTILKSLHAGRWLFLLLNLWFCAKLKAQSSEFKNHLVIMNFHLELFIFSFNKILKTNLGDLEKSGDFFFDDFIFEISCFH